MRLDECAPPADLGYTYVRTGRHNDALALLQGVLPKARQLGHQQTIRRLLNHPGLVLVLLERNAEGLTYYEESVRISGELDDLVGEVVGLTNLGILIESLGHYHESLDCDQRALAIARQLGERLYEGRILGNIAEHADRVLSRRPSQQDERRVRPIRLPGRFPGRLPDNDKWIMSGYGDGFYRLQNVLADRCLDESIQYGLRTNPTCQPPGKYQRFQAWRFSGMGEASVYRMQVMSTKTCLADGLTRVHPTLAKCVLHGDSRAVYQTWIRRSAA